MVSITINSINTNIEGAWQLQNWLPLASQGSNQGPNYNAPKFEGVVHRTKKRKDNTVLLPFILYGINDGSGTPHSDVFAGLVENYQSLLSSWVDASAANPITATVTFDDASTISGSVECPEFTVASLDGLRLRTWSGVLEVVMLDGRLT